MRNNIMDNNIMDNLADIVNFIDFKINYIKDTKNKLKTIDDCLDWINLTVDILHLIKQNIKNGKNKKEDF